MRKVKNKTEYVYFSKPAYGAHEVEEILKHFASKAYGHGLDGNQMYIAFKHAHNSRTKQDYIN